MSDIPTNKNIEKAPENDIQRPPLRLAAQKDDKGPKNDQLSADSVSKNGIHMGATHVLPSKAHIVMQSAVTKISGNNKQYYQARILFDTGSQRTVITQEMKHKLKLGTMGSELLDVTTFGTLQGRRKTYDLVALTLSTEAENIKITALVSPVICPPLSAKVKNLQIPPEFQGLKVAPYSFWTARELISKISRWRELSISTLKSRAESRSKMPTNMASKFLKFVYR